MVSYKRLLHILVDRDLELTSFILNCGLSSNIVTKIKNNQNVEIKTLEKICLKLEVNIGDICDILPDD